MPAGDEQWNEIVRFMGKLDIYMATTTSQLQRHEVEISRAISFGERIARSETYLKVVGAAVLLMVPAIVTVGIKVIGS